MPMYDGDDLEAVGPGDQHAVALVDGLDDADRGVDPGEHLSAGAATAIRACTFQPVEATSRRTKSV